LEDWIVPTALLLPASTALSSHTATGFVRIGTGLGIRSTALASATGTGFSPASTAFARRFFFLGTTCTRFAATSATFPVIGKPIGYKCPTGKQAGNTKPSQELFQLLLIHTPFTSSPRLLSKQKDFGFSPLLLGACRIDSFLTSEILLAGNPACSACFLMSSSLGEI
jgi:hypothetical protein